MTILPLNAALMGLFYCLEACYQRPYRGGTIWTLSNPNRTEADKKIEAFLRFHQEKLPELKGIILGSIIWKAPTVAEIAVRLGLDLDHPDTESLVCREIELLDERGYCYCPLLGRETPEVAFQLLGLYSSSRKIKGAVARFRDQQARQAFHQGAEERTRMENRRADAMRLVDTHIPVPNLRDIVMAYCGPEEAALSIPQVSRSLRAFEDLCVQS
jgi:hypothetical protein